MSEKNEITAYSKNDFLDGTKPFEEVYKSIDNGFELERAINKMSTMAQAVGVKNFKTLFKKYCDQIKAMGGGIIADNVSNFENQELDLVTGIWQADESGVTTEGPFGTTFACVHPIMPIKRLVNVATGVEKLELSFKKGRQWRKMICEKKQLASSNSIVALSDYGVAVNSENAKFLVRYLHDVENLNYETIPENNSVGRLGWIGEEGFSPYVENLVFDGDVTFKHFFESVQEKGSLDKWIEEAKKVRASKNVPARILLAASFASVLVEPCNCLPFFVHLWGGTETGKTVGLMLACSVWANPEMGKYIHTFNSTAVAQELSAGFVNSLPLILDELQIIKDKKDFDQMIYQLSEGVGRSRGQKTGGLQRTNTWNNCIITTGEQPISSGHSGGGAVNRIVEISCEEEKLFKEPAHLVSVLRKNYGLAGKKFMDHLADKANLDSAKKMQKDLYKMLSEDKITDKQALSASLILTAELLINELFFKDNNDLSIADISKFLATHDDVSVNKRAYEWLMQWVAQNHNKFNEDNDMTETWGRVTDRNISIVRSVFDKACYEYNFNPSSFLSWLKRNNLLELQKNGKGYTRLIRIDGIPCQCVDLINCHDGYQGFIEIDEESEPF